MYITVSSLTLLFLLYSQFQSTFCYIDIDREHTLTNIDNPPSRRWDIREGCADKQIRTLHVSMENGIEFGNWGFLCAFLKCRVTSVINDDINLATWKRLYGCIDNIFAEIQRGGVSLNSDNLDTKALDLC